MLEKMERTFLGDISFFSCLFYQFFLLSFLQELGIKLIQFLLYMPMENLDYGVLALILKT